MINSETTEVFSAEDTILPSESFSLSAASIFLLHTLSKKKQTEDKQAEVDTKPKKLDIGQKKHIAAINAYAERNILHTAQKQKFSRVLKLAKHTEFATVVCNETGIISILEIPFIPGQALTYNHPLSELANARGIAQQGIDYLRKLDTQILAGILLVLAADYSLFVYQPADTGAQRNAILRTVNKNVLINAILTIEDMVHSSNHSYLPKLALILDAEIVQGGIEDRLRQWLKLMVAAIYKPDTEVWDENETEQRRIKRENRRQEMSRVSEESSTRKQKKLLKDDCKLAIGIIKDLYKQELVSSKLRIFLGGVFQEFQLLAMDASARILLTGKLKDIGNINSAKLSEILNKDRGDLVAGTTPMDDFFTDKTEVKAVRVSVSKPETDKPATEVIVLSIEVAAPGVEADQQRISISGKDFVVSTAFYTALSFIGKVKYHKALLAGTTQELSESIGEAK